MIGNYLKIALRNVRKHKGYALVNIAGLAIGMACCILIGIYILTELSYDKFHEKAPQIYRMGIDAKLGGNIIKLPITNAPVGPVLVDDYPEVLSAVRLRRRDRIPVKYNDRLFYEDEILWADNSIFEIFTFPMIKGDPGTALDRAYTVVLTRSLAEKYFGDEEPIGKMLRLNNLDDYTVTGVVEEVPHNSHFTFNMLCSFETLYASKRLERDFWLNFNLYTYLLLPENYDYRQLEDKFPALVEKYMGQQIQAMGGEIKYFLQPLSRIHLYSHMENEIAATGDIRNVYIFSAIALFILFIACINFMNLATARSAIRAKEVGMRKVIGAGRSELIRQFMGESLVYSLVALVLGFFLVQMALPFFRSMSGIELRFSLSEAGWMIPGLLGLVIFVGLVAGCYPALFLSAFQPARVLKGDIKSKGVHSRLRSVLVTAQFVISVALIIGTGIIINQIRFMKNKSLGFSKKNILVVPIMDNEIEKVLESIKARLREIPGVVSAGASSVVPGGEPDVVPFVPEGFTEEQSQPMEWIGVDPDFLPTLGIDIVAGRNFSREFGTDQEQTVIINEAAARRFGWEDPVDKTIRQPDDAPSTAIKWKTRTVIGIVKDFHLNSLHQIIGPLFITNTPDYLNMLSIKISSINQATTLEQIKETWKTIDPGRPFDYFFLDDSFDSQYRSEEKLSDIIASFTAFAIFVACLGLFGMASFATEQRGKEIGIRKVLGATVPNVLVHLTKDFIKLVAIANIIAWPFVYFGMKNWLQDFAYRTQIGFGVFLLTGL
ncbi:MAG: ABC transporter permease, partial [Candidatus Aminicenantes bacterium]|nr:ABC transporter permease [Candidatus Aminicenantes bacterium]